MKKLLHICLGILGSAAIAQAQNVGIAEAAPNSKLDIIQTETTGNTIEVNHNVTTNASSAVWIRNFGTNRGLNVGNLSATSNAEVANFYQGGNGAFADGLIVTQDVNTPASTSGLFINNLGLSFGGYALMDVANTNPAWVADHAGAGQGLFVLQTGTGDGIYNEVTGGAGIINFVANNNIGVLNDLSTAGGTGGYSYLAANGGNGFRVLATDNPATPNLGTGGDVYAFFADVNTATPTGGGTVFGSVIAGNQYGPGHGILIAHSGASGRNAEFNINGAANADEVIFATHAGTGSVINGQNQTLAPPAAAINVARFDYVGADNAQDHRAILGTSNPGTTTGFGIGVQGQGGYIGVIGFESAGAASFAGVVAVGDMVATGVKPFIMDHPLDPENKYLRHFALESNEVLNMYRGMITLDANGEAIIDMPDYFEAINKDFSYQLTAIGTPQQPYVAEELENGQFKVAGAPNTKVSWMVLAERNDPYTQQRPEKLRVEFDKENARKGKYLMPSLYGQAEEKGIFYTPKAERKQPTKLKLPSESLKTRTNNKKELNRKTAPATDKLKEDLTSTK